MSTPPTNDPLQRLQQQLRDFAKARQWEPFHTPKNLSMALTVEASELQEIFQWLIEAQSRQLTELQRQHAREELADVFLYLCRLADVLNIDLWDAAQAKLLINARKYPAEQVRGSAEKYREG